MLHFGQSLTYWKPRAFANRLAKPCLTAKLSRIRYAGSMWCSIWKRQTITHIWGKTIIQGLSSNSIHGKVMEMIEAFWTFSDMGESMKCIIISDTLGNCLNIQVEVVTWDKILITSTCSQYLNDQYFINQCSEILIQYQHKFHAYLIKNIYILEKNVYRVRIMCMVYGLFCFVVAICQSLYPNIL